ncbi:MAG: winged helix-turn-helix domain-containing protein [Tannerella sp.]|nr:winged helix-turn-helix domain-containing protein [Tannerella sp.]
MTTEIIGTTAGVVWTVLSTSGKLATKELKKATKIKTDKLLYSALGWLAKEDKLGFEEKNDDLYVWLT